MNAATTVLEGEFHVGALRGVPATDKKAGRFELALRTPSVAGRCSFLGDITADERLLLEIMPEGFESADAPGQWEGQVVLKGFRVSPGAEHPQLDLVLVAQDREGGACDRASLFALWLRLDRERPTMRVPLRIQRVQAVLPLD